MNQSKKHLARLTAFMLVAGMSVPYMIPADVQMKEVNVSAEEAAVELSAADLFISKPVEGKNYKTYCDGSKSFQMNGRTYYQGIVMGEDAYYYDSEIVFDVENVNSISFTLGCVDTSGYGDSNPAYINIDFDGVTKKYAVTKGMITDPETIDVSACKTLKIRKENYRGKIALADISVDNVEPSKKYELQPYKDTVDMMNRVYNALETEKIYDGSDKSKSFNLCGRTYYQGVLLKGIESEFSLNVEDLKEVSFSIGHVDDTGNYDDEITEIIIYLDGEMYNIPIKRMDRYPIEDFKIPVDGVKTLRICKKGESYSQYAIANIKADDLALNYDYDITYSDSASFIDAYYNVNGVKSYDGLGNESFKMGGRTYYQGYVMGSSSYTKFSLNVENVKTINFDLGYQESDYFTILSETELLIIYDGESEPRKRIPLSYIKQLPKDRYELDVSDAKTICFELKGRAAGEVCIGNVVADELSPDKSYDIPKNETVGEFIYSAYDVSYGAKKYTDKIDSFTMSGQKYLEGITTGTHGNSIIAFNVENLGAVSFLFGSVDGENNNGDDNGVLNIYVDNEKVSEEITTNMAPKKYIFNVLNASRLLVEIPDNWNSYGLADFSISKEAPAEVTPVPTEEPSPTPEASPTAVPTAEPSPTTAASPTVAPTAEPTAAPTSATTVPTVVPSPSPKPLADLTGDGKASTSDVRTLIKSIIGEVELTDEQKAASDLDGDGKVDSVDAVLYLKRVVETVAEKEYR